MLNNYNYQLDSAEQDILDAYENGNLNGAPVLKLSKMPWQLPS